MLSPEWAAVQECYTSSQACTIYNTFTFLLLSLSLEQVLEKGLADLKMFSRFAVCLFWYFQHKTLKPCLQSDSVFNNLLLEPIQLYFVSLPCHSHVVPRLLQRGCQQNTSLRLQRLITYFVFFKKSWHFFAIVCLTILVYMIWELEKKRSCHVICTSVYKGNILLKHIPLNCFCKIFPYKYTLEKKNSGWFYILCF